MTTWPTNDDLNTNPYFGDGKTYGRELGRVSPEGNIYGQTRWVRDVSHWIWWDGNRWASFFYSGVVGTLEDLPSGPRPFGEVWAIPNHYDSIGGGWIWDYYYWDSEDSQFKAMKILWTVQNLDEIPATGSFIGEAHEVLEPEVQVMWNGFAWVRFNHSALQDDEPNRHLPAGFISLLSPNSQIRWVSPKEIGIELVQAGIGYELVATDKVVPGPKCSVFNSCPVLSLDVDGNLVVTDLAVSTEYWIYLANTLDATFSTSSWDFRGKLFLSTTAPDGNYLASTGTGRNAKLAGIIQTGATLGSDDFPTFDRGIDISLISRRPSIVEAFRDFSDYRVVFVNQNLIQLQKLDGLYGQIYVPSSLNYLGEGEWITVDDPKVVISNDVPNANTSALQSNAEYHIYLPAGVDPFNFNETNPKTGRPWQADDEGADATYEFLMDLRLKPFLSLQVPSHERLSDTWPGFYARHIGKIRTDGNGKFSPARDLSVIAPTPLDPVAFDGLAEISFVSQNETEFIIAKRPGSSGYIQVGGEYVRAYSQYDQNVLTLTHNDLAQTYNEGNPATPLTDSDPVNTFGGEVLHLYMANSRSLWGNLASQAFFCETAPTDGYLSTNWPGNQARWLAVIQIDPTGRFVGTFILDSIAPAALLIDDTGASPSKAVSGAKLQAEMNRLTTMIDAAATFTSQQTHGCNVRLAYNDHHSIRLVPSAGSEVTVVTPDLSILDVPSGSLFLDISGSDDGVFYYVYLNENGLYLSTDEPTTEYAKMSVKGTDSVLVGYVGFGDFQQTQTASPTAFTISTSASNVVQWIKDSTNKGHLVDSGGNRLSLGTGHDCPNVGKFQKVVFGDGYRKIRNIVGSGSADNGVELDSDHGTASVLGIFGVELVNNALTPTTSLECDGTLVQGSQIYPNSSTCSSGSNVEQAFDNVFPSNDQYHGYANGWDAGTSPGASITAIFSSPTILNGYESCVFYKWEVVGNHQECISWDNDGNCLAWGTADDYGWVAYNPTAIKTEGSNDGGQTWTTLKSSGAGAGYVGWYNSTAFVRYRWTVLSGASRIGELKLFTPIAARPNTKPSLVYLPTVAGADPIWWEQWDQCAPIETIGTNSSIHYAASTDSGVTWKVYQNSAWRDIAKLDTRTWKYHDGSQWQNASTNDMERALTQALSDSDNHMTGAALTALIHTSLSFDATKKIQVAALITCDYSSTVSFSGLTLKYLERDRVAGEWSIYSCWNQTELTYSALADGGSINLPGFVLPPSLSASRSRSGYYQATFCWQWRWGTYCTTPPVTVGTGQCIPHQYPASITAAWSGAFPSTDGPSVTNIELQLVQTFDPGRDNDELVSQTKTGNIYVTRPGNI